LGGSPVHDSHPSRLQEIGRSGGPGGFPPARRTPGFFDGPESAAARQPLLTGCRRSGDQEGQEVSSVTPHFRVLDWADHRSTTATAHGLQEIGRSGGPGGFLRHAVLPGSSIGRITGPRQPLLTVAGDREIRRARRFFSGTPHSCVHRWAGVSCRTAATRRSSRTTATRLSPTVSVYRSCRRQVNPGVSRLREDPGDSVAVDRGAATSR
jgi:hypothetical protein